MSVALDPILAAVPIVLLVYLMTKKRSMPSNQALPLVAVLMYAILIFYFAFRPLLVNAAVMEGLLTALTPITIVWGAILLFRTMEHTGAMDIVRQWLNTITVNPVAQLMIIGWSFSFLVEGVSGFGTPPALAAPLLVGLGFKPMQAAVLCLMMNTVPVSFGAVGMPTWFGLGNLGLTTEELREVGFKTAVIHAAASLVIPILALRVVVSTREIRANLGFIALVIGSTISVSVAVASFNNEFPSIAGGACGLAASVWLASHGIGLEATELSKPSQKIRSISLLKATFPLWATLLVLIVTRLNALPFRAWLLATSPSWNLPLPWLGELRVSPSLVVQWQRIFSTELNWSHAVLYVPSVIPFLIVSLATFAIYRPPLAEARAAFRDSFLQVLKPIGAFLGAIVFVKLLMVGGDRSCSTILGQWLAIGGGQGWQFVAVYLGALGSFFSGSNTVSNLTFGGIQEATATTIGLSRTTILSLQSVGGAMGNMVCIHNLVAVCSILGLKDEEGNILRQTLLPTFIYGAIASLVALAF